MLLDSYNGGTVFLDFFVIPLWFVGNLDELDDEFTNVFFCF